MYNVRDMGWYSNQCQYIKEITKEWLSPTLLHHVLLFDAQFQHIRLPLAYPLIRLCITKHMICL